MNTLILRSQRTVGGALVLGAVQALAPSGPGTLTSSSLTFNNGEPHESAPFIATVLTLDVPPTIVLVKQGLTSVFSAVPEDHYFCSFADAALTIGVYYGVHWHRTDIGTRGAHGFEILQATAPP